MTGGREANGSEGGDEASTDGAKSEGQSGDEGVEEIVGWGEASTAKTAGRRGGEEDCDATVNWRSAGEDDASTMSGKWSPVLHDGAESHAGQRRSRADETREGRALKRRAMSPFRDQ